MQPPNSGKDLDKYIFTGACRTNPDPRPQIPEEDVCHPHHGEDNFAKAVPLTIVTTASAEYYDHLTNIIGSIQYWEPDAQIAVYDLGLSDWQADEMRGMCGVRLIPFPFEKYPRVVGSYLSDFAWKAPLIREAVDKFGKVNMHMHTDNRSFTFIHIRLLIAIILFLIHRYTTPTQGWSSGSRSRSSSGGSTRTCTSAWG